MYVIDKIFVRHYNLYLCIEKYFIVKKTVWTFVVLNDLDCYFSYFVFIYCIGSYPLKKNP